MYAKDQGQIEFINTTNEVDLTDIVRIIHPTIEYTVFSRILRMLGQETDLKNFRENEIT